MSPSIPSHPPGLTPGIKPVLPTQALRTERCEMSLQISVFFDGTGNNQEWDEADSCSAGLGGTQQSCRKDSNVARLFRAYPDEPLNGYYRLYVHGVGTPCDLIGERPPASNGMGFGGGGDGRINVALLHVLNSMHRTISPTHLPLISHESAIALCRNDQRTEQMSLGSLNPAAPTLSPLRYPHDIHMLREVGMDQTGGLLCDAHGNRPQATAFFKTQTAKLAALITAAARPKVVEIFIDVFGFSRGAAQARVFCQWLTQMMEDGRLCGVAAQIRFLGLFDTVASVGPASHMAPYDLSNGHYGWAQPENLLVPASVKNCVHYVAMHENRASFPVDWVSRPDGTLPPHCKQYMLPGMHTDVGGGYAPAAQGRGLHGDDSEKLSQIALVKMYQAAQAACVPIDRILAQTRNGYVVAYDPFAVHPDLLAAYNAFMHAVPDRGTQAEWLLPYLAWRYQVREVYPRLSWYARASAKDRDDLMGANGTLLADITALDATDTVWKKAACDLLHIFVSKTVPESHLVPAYWLHDQSAASRQLAPDARDLLGNIRAYPPLATADNPEQMTPQAMLFANYVHDSYAGFRPFDVMLRIECYGVIPGSWEPEGYLRYRRVYSGSDQPLTAAPPPAQPPPPSADELQRQNVQMDIDKYGMGSASWPH